MKLKVLTFLLIGLISTTGCEYQKLLKKGSPEEKLVGAKRYFNKKDYGRALPLLEDLIGSFRNREQAEDVYFYYAYTHYMMGDYILAGHHFRKFTETYRRSEHLEESSFMVAKCAYHKTLPAELDQTNTKKAIEQIQLFINKYPKSKFVEESNTLMDELRTKLHNKAYANSMMYYNVGDYRSAVVSFKNAITVFPDIPQKDELDYLIVESALLYAEKSILKVQKARYEAVQFEIAEYYLEHDKSNPYFSKVQKIEEQAKKAIKTLAENEMPK